MIIFCITGGTGASSDCNVDSLAGDRDDDGILENGVHHNSLRKGEKDGNLMGTASATEIIGTCGGAGGNCAWAFAISPGANFSIHLLVVDNEKLAYQMLLSHHISQSDWLYCCY